MYPAIGDSAVEINFSLNFLRQLLAYFPARHALFQREKKQSLISWSSWESTEMFLHIGIVEKQFHVIMDISFYPNKWSPYITSPSWKGTKLRKM